MNLDAAPSDDGPLHVRPGDALALPQYDDNAFDIVHSNSVIEQVCARMLMRKRRGFRGPLPDIASAMDSIQSVVLLDAAQMTTLFPDARIEREKVALLTKSLIAVR